MPDLADLYPGYAARRPRKLGSNSSAAGFRSGIL
jgi:hypothetical protein